MSWSTCAFTPDYDRVTLEPKGEQCGAPAVEWLHWKDGRVSPACSDHGLAALTPETHELVDHISAEPPADD